MIYCRPKSLNLSPEFLWPPAPEILHNIGSRALTGADASGRNRIKERGRAGCMTDRGSMPIARARSPPIACICSRRLMGTRRKVSAPQQLGQLFRGKGDVPATRLASPDLTPPTLAGS